MLILKTPLTLIEFKEPGITHTHDIFNLKEKIQQAVHFMHCVKSVNYDFR